MAQPLPHDSAGEGLEGKLRSMILSNAVSDPVSVDTNVDRPNPRQRQGPNKTATHQQRYSLRSNDQPEGTSRQKPQAVPQQTQNFSNRQIFQRQQAQPEQITNPIGQRRGVHHQQYNNNHDPNRQPNRGHQWQNNPRNAQAAPDLAPVSQQRPQQDRRNQQFQSLPFAPLHRPSFPAAAIVNIQSTHLEKMASQLVPSLRIQPQELAEMDAFRKRLQSEFEKVVIESTPPSPTSLQLLPFGSISSGFAMPGSDMDLSLMMSADIPGFFRMIEKALLDIGIGAHLLTRTRVPILKVCQKPPPELLAALRGEREKWDAMTDEDREKHDNNAKPEVGQTRNQPSQTNGHTAEAEVKAESRKSNAQKHGTAIPSSPESQAVAQVASPEQSVHAPGIRQKRQWFREKRLGPLDFPKDGVGVQCDVNTANPLGIHNTWLLRCYSHCDPRVQSMVLFIKAWASKRQINSSRNGTLSSYGYVLMVLHFLVNVANPPVCPNLQLHRSRGSQIDMKDPNAYCEGKDVRFWRNGAEIKNLATKGMLTHNRDPLGLLLRNFFAYYTQHDGFIWTKQVLSLRTEGGILSKEYKGWTGAKTTMLDKNEVRNRYLLAIEDPFETDHNVARTVIHEGIVSIRDEFRRAWGILLAVGNGRNNIENLFEPSLSIQPPSPDPEAGAEKTAGLSVGKS